MVDVDRRLSGLNPAHIAGLRRLSARAASVSSTTVSNTHTLLPFSSLAAVEFWRGAAVDRRRRISSSAKWVEQYIGRMESVLREGGWSESDISEMVEVSGSGIVQRDMDRFSESLRKSGWSSEEVLDAFGFHSPPENEPIPPK
ncbi:hypothetical protein RJT34_30715 [Clitoria ternatea]|uniref:Uncharacterized protein n=1 Tax=Clitoria ternatea TaxID=43366 RepID=A0AAN9EXI4_CLITE